jgi:hypothetical protein
MKFPIPVRALSGAVTLLLGLLLASAVAQAETPNPGYGQFSGCPSTKEVPVVAVCQRAVVKGGHFEMGNKDVPLTNPMVLSGGLDGTGAGPIYFSPNGGLTPVKQTVPGGVIGITGLDWLVNFLNIEQLKLYAVTELAGTPSVNEEIITLPIKVHLVNTALGNSCYVGSNSAPIILHLTFNTTNPPPPNEPISGVIPKFIFDSETGIVTLPGGVYVDNSFAAPGANGCTLTLFGFIPVSLNGLVNLQAGLPSPAGTNETIQNIDMELAPVSKVYP